MGFFQYAGPMSFSEILCQEKAVGLLQRAYAAGRDAHAYIFAGPDGVGRYKTAVQWAKLLLCECPRERPSAGFDSCDACRSCHGVDAGTHPDFFHVYKELRQFTADGKGKAAPVDLVIDVIREFLIDKVGGRPTQSGRKVFVVSEAERLNIASQNALLKVLEEPPAYCSIILLCTRLEKLLPTIKSRAQTVRFGPVEAAVIENDLLESGIKPDAARYFSRLAQGRWGLAQRLGQLEANGADLLAGKQRLLTAVGRLQLGQCVDVAQKCLDFGKRISATWTELEPQTSKTDLNRRGQRLLIQMVMSALEDVMKRSVQPDYRLINADQGEVMGQWSQRYDPETGARCIEECYEALRWIEAGTNEKLVFEHLLLSMADTGIL